MFFSLFGQTGQTQNDFRRRSRRMEKIYGEVLEEK